VAEDAVGTEGGIGLTDDFLELLQHHRQRVADLRVSLDTGGDLTATVVELEVAHEELRVAEEEMSAQREQIEDLLARNQDERGWRDRLSTALPVPVVVTDPRGVVLEANPAGAFLLGLDRRHLVGKPLHVFVHDSDRTRLRHALTRLTSKQDAEVRETVTLQPRRRSPLKASVVGFAEAADDADGTQVRWVLVPALAPDDESVRHDRDLATATAFAELCRLPVTEVDDMQSVLGRVATLGRDAVPAATAMSVSLGDPAEPELIGTESTFAQEVDGAQIRAGEGPCREAWTTRQTVLSDDVGADPRWPVLAEQARRIGVGAVLAVPVHGPEGVLGVLNIYADEVGAFDQESVEIAELLSVAAGAVVVDARGRSSLRRLSEQLRTALDSRAVIDQAKGMLMALHGLSSDEAFAHIVKVSRNSNVKVRDVAERLVRENSRAHQRSGQGRTGPNGS
jgi:PAS domain S-box-containing protein